MAFDEKVNLSEVEKELLELLLEEEGIKIPPPQTIRPRKEAGAAPLSFAQQRLWFLDQLETGSPFYNIARPIRLTGTLNVDALELSINEIIRRHEALRTTFINVGGKPHQVIDPAMNLSLESVDLSELQETERGDEASRLATEEAQKPFNLAQCPLLRAKLLRLSNKEHILLLTMHHIVSDGWSMGVFFKELSALYKAFSIGIPSPLTELPIQYADFSVWQREWLQGEVLQNQLSYWKQQLDGAPPSLELPTDRPRPPVQTYRGARQNLILSKIVSEKLKELSQQEGVTLFITMLAAFQTLLHRYTGQDDIVVGTPIAGRIRPEIMGLIGFFVNTLVMRTDLSGNPSFRELLSRVRKVALDAYEHQDLPFEKLVETLQPKRDPSYNPVFQVMFTLQNAPMQAPELQGLTMSPLDVDRGTAIFDLTLSLMENDQGLKGSIEYNTDLFDAVTITRLLGHFQILLEGIVANPEQSISDLPLITQREMQQLLVEWNDTQKDYQKSKCIHQFFEEQVESTPDATAVVFEEKKLTYGELNRRANQLAHHLLSLGVGLDVLVGICVERSLEMVVGILGILKAGGAYVPLDPGNPKERLAFMLKDTKTPVLLTQQKHLKKLPTNQRKVVCLDSERQHITQQSIDNLENRVTSDNLAYVIYTSGSLGKPKGVSVTHYNVVRLYRATQTYFNFDTNDVWTLFHSTAFDFSVWEIWGALLYGGRLVVVPYNVSRSPQAFYDLLSREQVTVLNQTPSAFHQLIEADKSSHAIKDLSLRIVIFGGEALRFQNLKPWIDRHGDRCPQLVNMYGITETTVHVTYHPFSSEDILSASGSLIGSPILDLRVYLLDKYMQLVPVGVPGEIHIGGPGLARGYLSRSDLTAERFIPDPFSKEPGTRLYRSGDLARYRSNGDLEYSGRLDHQVKIRGFRVELGEIESVMGQHTAVGECVVMAREDIPGERRLVAYVVPGKEQALTISELRRYLEEKLPEYMVPSAFICLDALPLTTNGKVNRRALPVPDLTRPELEEAFVAPRTPVEQILADIWAQVLSLEKVGIHDNFFELGGHSLLATQLISRVREILDVELPLRFMFETPTVAGLADRIESAQREQSIQAPSLRSVSRDRDLPLSFAQQRLWFLDKLLPGSYVYNIPTALQINGSLDIPALELSLNSIVRRHEALRTNFSVVEGQPVQVIAPAQTLKLPMVDIRQLPEQERKAESQRLITEEARQAFDLAQGPLLRVKLLRMDEEEHILLLTMHHIATDHWSRAILLREISALYEAFSTGKPSPLPELPIQYADFAVWQRQWLEGEVLEDQLDYWKQQLMDLPVLDLPTDRPRPAAQTYRGARQSMVIPKYMDEGIKALGQREGVTTFMILLATFKVLMHKYTGQDDIVVGSPIAGRNRVEIEGLIGFFLNNLVLRTDLSGNPSFKELLGRVREVCLGAYAHQDVPFEKILEELQPERDLSRTPLFQIYFNEYSFEQAQFELHGLTTKQLATSELISNFDLTLYVRERHDETYLSLVYNADLFRPDRMANMLEQFIHLLKQIVENPDERIDSFSLVTPAIEGHLPNPTQPLHSDCGESVHTLFSKQAQQVPERPAVLDKQGVWTYRELDCRSNQLANYLLASGIRSKDIVAIYGHRCSSLVLALLGILKAGAAFLILDPAYPALRLIEYLRIAKPRGLLLIKEAGVLPEALDEFLANLSCSCRLELPQTSTAETTDILMDYSNDDPRTEVSPDDLTYVAFTSGSTGMPKGILGTHRPLSHFLQWHTQTFSLNEKDRFSMLSGLTHDPLLRDIFTPLLLGATLCIPDPEDISPGRLAEWMKQKEISIAHLTPAMEQILTETNQGITLNSLHYAFFGGEVLTRGDITKLRKIAPSVTCVNFYGATETPQAMGYIIVPTQDYIIQDDSSDGRYLKESIPLGRGISDVQLLVLNTSHQLAGINEHGEIYIRTPYLAQGYLGDDALTRERFILNPFTKVPGDRLYRTGDLGRYLPDGTVEFAGRNDHQVKIRGFRVELGEIEDVLGQHPAVGECVVMAREDQPGDPSAPLRTGKRLIAYVVSSKEPPPSIGELRTYLRQKLPEYMLPSVYVMMDTFPLTPNGKVDRESLPEPEMDRPDLDESFVAPRTPVEELIADIWKELLGLEKVGIHDNFFELGGHSLLATQVISRIRDTFHMEVPLRSIFETPTVAGLAEMLAKNETFRGQTESIARLRKKIDEMSSEEIRDAIHNKKMSKS